MTTGQASAGAAGPAGASAAGPATAGAPGYNPRRTLPFRVEAIRQLRRRRTMIAFGILLVLPWILVGAFEVSGPASPGGGTPGLVTMATHGAGERRNNSRSGWISAASPTAPIMVSTQYFVISASAPASPSHRPARTVRFSNAFR